MEEFAQLQREYVETKKCLAFPLSFDDLGQLKERSRIIRAKAKALAERLNILEPGWFSE